LRIINLRKRSKGGEPKLLLSVVLREKDREREKEREIERENAVTEIDNTTI